MLKSRFVQAKLLATNLARAQQVYFLANDDYATKLGDLDLEVPLSRSGEVCSGSSCNYKWGRVYLPSDKTYVAGTLWTDGSNDTVRYIIPLTEGDKPYCLVTDTTSAKATYQALCKSETGDTTPSWSGTKYDYE